MNRCRSILFECCNMFRASISFIGSKTILRINRIIVYHHPVPGHLGNDRCRTDGNALCISLDNRYLRNCHFRNRHCIIKQQIRLRRSLCNRLPHCLIRCLQNIDLINPVRTDRAKSGCHCLLHDDIIQFFSFCR